MNFSFNNIHNLSFINEADVNYKDWNPILITSFGAFGKDDKDKYKQYFFNSNKAYSLYILPYGTHVKYDLKLNNIKEYVTLNFNAISNNKFFEKLKDIHDNTQSLNKPELLNNFYNKINEYTKNVSSIIKDNIGILYDIHEHDLFKQVNSQHFNNKIKELKTNPDYKFLNDNIKNNIISIYNSYSMIKKSTFDKEITTFESLDDLKDGGIITDDTIDSGIRNVFTPGYLFKTENDGQLYKVLDNYKIQKTTVKENIPNLIDNIVSDNITTNKEKIITNDPNISLSNKNKNVINFFNQRLKSTEDKDVLNSVQEYIVVGTLIPLMDYVQKFEEKINNGSFKNLNDLTFHYTLLLNAIDKYTAQDGFSMRSNDLKNYKVTLVDYIKALYVEKGLNSEKFKKEIDQMQAKTDNQDKENMVGKPLDPEDQVPGFLILKTAANLKLNQPITLRESDFLAQDKSGANKFESNYISTFVSALEELTGYSIPSEVSSVISSYENVRSFANKTIKGTVGGIIGSILTGPIAAARAKNKGRVPKEEYYKQINSAIEKTGIITDQTLARTPEANKTLDQAEGDFKRLLGFRAKYDQNINKKVRQPKIKTQAAFYDNKNTQYKNVLNEEGEAAPATITPGESFNQPGILPTNNMDNMALSRINNKNSKHDKKGKTPIKQLLSLSDFLKSYEKINKIK